MLQPGDWLVKINLKEAYFTIPIHPSFQDLLSFQFQFTCLPFGLSCTPRVFTKVMKPIVAFLRERGVFHHIDDILAHHSPDQHSSTSTSPLGSGCAGTSRLPSQLHQVNHHTGTGNRIPWIVGELQNHDSHRRRCQRSKRKHTNSSNQQWCLYGI